MNGFLLLLGLACFTFALVLVVRRVRAALYRRTLKRRLATVVGHPERRVRRIVTAAW